MAILIGCHGCGKSFSVPDHFAGKSGKCKHCGTALDVPAFVPSVAADPVRLTDRPRRRAWRIPRIGCLPLAGISAAAPLFLLVLFLALRGGPDDRDYIEFVGRLLLLLAVLMAPVLILLGPAILARRGVMSLARWLVAALFFACVAGVLYFMASLVFEGTPVMQRQMAAMKGELLASDYLVFAAILCLLFIPSCVLAAVVYKPR